MSYQQPYGQPTQPVHYPSTGSYGPPTQPPAASRHAARGGLPWWGTVLIAGATFVAGCVGGGLVTSLGADPGQGEPAAAETSSPAVTESPTAAPTTEPPASEEPSEAPEEAEPETLAIPDVLGRNAALVDEQLRELGFTNVRYASADADDTVVLLLANWTVIDVEPGPGTEIEAGDLVVVTCSKQA